MKQFSMGLLCAILLLSSCQKQVTKVNDLGRLSATTNSAAAFSLQREPGTACGTALTTTMVTSPYPPVDEQVKGALKISNDASNLYITVSTTGGGVFIGSIQVLYGDLAFMSSFDPYSWDGWFGTNNPQVNVQVPADQTSYTVTIPLSSLPANCLYFNVHALFYTYDQYAKPVHFPVWLKPLAPGDMAMSFPWSAYVQYCKQTCIVPTCGQLRTQTPGGWGAKPAGNNPGTYLHANFAKAFPTGLVIGCATGNTINLTTASAVTNLLPAGGKAEKLTSSAVNPTGVKNVLVGHLVALTLSVTFDNYDVNFGQAGVTLGAMIIGSGAFKGWTVADFLAEANKVLGGCSSTFTIQQVLDTATMINENYVDGKSDKKFLVCPTK